MTARAELAFHILGELEVTSQGERIEIGRERQRALLAVLLLSSGETVTTDRLIEGIWGERSPASADQLVRVYVSQLRALVGEDAIQTRTRGYALGSDNAIVDSRRFEELVAKARAERANHHLDDALTTYDAALQFWRGPVLAGTPLEGDAAIRAAHGCS